MTSKPRGKAVAAKDKTGAGVPRPVRWVQTVAGEWGGGEIQYDG